MADQKKSPASPDSLTEAGKAAKVELTEAQLQEATGGAYDAFLKLDGIKTADKSSTPAQAVSINFTLKP